MRKQGIGEDGTELTEVSVLIEPSREGKAIRVCCIAYAKAQRSLGTKGDEGTMDLTSE